MQGIALSNDTSPVGKIGCIMGQNKHFLEAGLLIAPFGEEITNKFLPAVGYQYHTAKGMIIRADVSIFIDTGTYKDGSGEWTKIYPYPGIAFGYSF